MRVKVLVFKQYRNSQMEICLLCEHGRVWLFASPWTVAPSRPSLLPHLLPALICVCSFMHSTNHCMCAPSCLTLCHPVDCSPPGSSVHGILPGENTGVRCHFQLQGIFLAQGLNLCLLHLLHWQVNSVPLLLLLLLLLLSHFSRVRLCASHRRQPPRLLCSWDSPRKRLEWAASAFSNASTHAKSLQACTTLCDPMDSSPPGSSVHGIPQARTLEWLPFLPP